MRAVEPPRASLATARGPLARAILVGLVGAAVLVLVGGVLASTAGLLFVAGVSGAGIGLTIARAAVAPPNALDPDVVPVVPRGTVVRWAVALALTAVALGAAGTWLVARTEGGTLGPLDYLWTTFGPFLVGELVVAGLAAAWGASAGPVTGR